MLLRNIQKWGCHKNWWYHCIPISGTKNRYGYILEIYYVLHKPSSNYMLSTTLNFSRKNEGKYKIFLIPNIIAITNVYRIPEVSFIWKKDSDGNSLIKDFDIRGCEFFCRIVNVLLVNILSVMKTILRILLYVLLTFWYRWSRNLFPPFYYNTKS